MYLHWYQKTVFVIEIEVLSLLLLLLHLFRYYYKRNNHI